MTEKFNLAIVGATGNVGREIISILEQREFPIENLYLLASSRSKGKKINFRNQDLIVSDLSEFDFSKTHIALFSIPPLAFHFGGLLMDPLLLQY